MRKAASELKKVLSNLKFDEEHALRLSTEDRLKYMRKTLRPLYISQGRHREVFGINGHYVVKVPFNPNYTAINTAEWNIFRRRQKAGAKWGNKPEPAKCCVVTVAGQKLLVMERLENVRTPDHRHEPIPTGWPGWVSQLDCEQCGISTRSGKVVAFDYGTDRSAFGC